MPTTPPSVPLLKSARSQMSSRMSLAQRVEGLGIAGLTHVVVDVPELDLPEAVHQRAVRILLGVGEGVVLAVDRHPFAPVLAGGEPEHEPEPPVGERVQPERAVGEATMQIHRRRDDGGLRHQERTDHIEKRSKHRWFSLYGCLFGGTRRSPGCVTYYRAQG